MRILVFKPDEIGDFILASGCIRLLAREHGEENLILVVKSEIAPLARREYPRARVVALPLKERVRGVNKDAVNIYRCFPAWLRLCVTRVDAAICLRSTRDYVQTGIFLSPRARRRVACENLLARTGKAKRIAFEKWTKRIFRPAILAYPGPRPGVPSELEANRLVAAELLGRDVSDAEIMPRLESAAWRGGDFWLLCPFSSSWTKDYDAANWAAALRGVADIVPRGGIRLAGAPDQTARLEEFAGALRAAGVACPVAVETPGPLADFPGVVGGAGMVLTVDTAAAHVACSLGAPAVVVACGMHAGAYGPYSPNGRQSWIVGDWAALGHRRWQESVRAETVGEAIRRAARA